MNITSYWKQAFQSFVETPGFKYRTKEIRAAKLVNIRKTPISVDNSFDIEVFVLKKRTVKRASDGDQKSDFCLVGDGSAMAWLRSKFDLEEKIWYELTNIQTKMLNDELVLIASHNSYKQTAQRTDVCTKRIQTETCIIQHKVTQSCKRMFLMCLRIADQT